MDIYCDIAVLTSKCVLSCILTGSGLTEGIQMGIVGDIFGGCLGSILVDPLVSLELLCASECHGAGRYGDTWE